MSEIKRDQIGFNEIFYCEKDGELFYSSSIRELVDQHKIPIVVDHESLELFLSLRFVPAPKTMIKNVFKLPPGCALGDKEALGDFKKIKKNYKKIKNIKDITNDLRNLLTDVIGESLGQVDKSASIGAVLSEGIDSLAIIWVLTHVFQRSCLVFYPTFEGEMYENKSHSNKILDAMGCNGEEVHITSEQGLHWLSDIVKNMDDCIGESELISSYGIQQSFENKCDINFLSHGAEILFGGIMFFLTMRDSEQNYQKGQVSFCSEKRAMRFISFLHDLAFRDKKNLTDLIDNNHLIEYLADYLDGDEDIVDLLIHWMLVSYVPEMLVRRNPTLQKKTNKKVIYPYLNERMVSYSYQIPAEFKVYGDINKFLVHEAFNDVLPRQSLKHFRPDFHIPLSKWTRKDNWFDFMNGVFYESDYFDYGFIKKKMDENYSGVKDNSETLFSLIIFEIWLKEIRTRCSTIIP